MRSKDFAFITILLISGELNAEEKPCGCPSVENGRIAPYYYTFESFYFPMSVNQKLSFSCLAGYTTLKGKQEERMVCTATGWSPEPRCFKKCAKPELTNGYIPDAKLLYTVQETMRYGCAAGYRTPGGQEEESVQCLAHGWSVPPACTREHETCLAPELQHGNYSTTQRTFRVRGRVRYQCAPGYVTAAGGPAGEAECRPSGWSAPPKCTRLKCSPLRQIENGYFHPVKQTYEEGDVVQYFCNENYYLSGSDLIQCYDFGWYPESPACEGRRNRCAPPPLPPHSRAQASLASYRHGAAVRVECEQHFQIQGPEEMRCAHGTWTEPPRCVEAKERTVCGRPPLVENAVTTRHSEAYYHGDQVTYGCQSGYHLRGPKDVTCKHGTWSLPPECVESSDACQPPPAIVHGAAVDGAQASYAAGTSVEYRCEQYYLLQGARWSRCERGQWSAPPVCLEPCAMNEEDLRRNNVEMKWKYEGKVLHGDLIDFVCKQGFELSPSTPLSELSVQCDRGQVKYPLCVKQESKKMCAPPPVIKNGVIVQSEAYPYVNGSSVEYRCYPNFFLQGPKEIYCIEGLWSTPPSCLEPCTLSSDEMEKNNLILKWSFDQRPFIFHGEYVEFVCRRDSFMAELSVMGSELRVLCDRGQLKYPRCIQRQRTQFYQEHVRT